MGVRVEASNILPLSTSAANTFLLLQRVSFLLQNGSYLLPVPGMLPLPEQSLSGTRDVQAALSLLRVEGTKGLREKAHSEGCFLQGVEA